MNKKHKEIGEFFIQQYNLKENTRFRFECARKSMFSFPEYRFPRLEIYQIAFIEGKKLSPIIADLMVLLRLQKRLIIEVVEPEVEEDSSEKSNRVQTINPRLLEGIIGPMEVDALNKVACSRYLLINFRNLGLIRIDDVEEIYRRRRLEMDSGLDFEPDKSFKVLSEEINKDRKNLESMGVPLKHWFKEIWLLYHDEKGLVRCVQIWKS